MYILWKVQLDKSKHDKLFSTTIQSPGLVFTMMASTLVCWIYSGVGRRFIWFMLCYTPQNTSHHTGIMSEEKEICSEKKEYERKHFLFRLFCLRVGWDVGWWLDCAETSKLAPFACLRIIGSATLQPVPGPWRKIATFPLGVFHCYCGYLNICQCGAAAEMDVGRMPRTRR